MIPFLAGIHHKYAYMPRLRVLTDRLAAMIGPGQSILDVGCGSGMLGAALAERLPGSTVEGVETHPRGGEPIKVHAYDGRSLPLPDNSFDAVIVADVLHHDRDPVAVLRECGRVARRLVVVKDHLQHGWLSHLRISILDWGANNPYGVECLYTYWTRDEWNDMFARAKLSVVSFDTPISLYHPMFDWLFGGDIHFIAATTKMSSASSAAEMVQSAG